MSKFLRVEDYQKELKRYRIYSAVEDLAGSLLYYDRKEDEDLPRGVIEEAIMNNDITVDSIVEHFKKALLRGLV